MAEDDQYIVAEHQLEGLLKKLTQGGIKLGSLDWVKLGRELKINEEVLKDAQTYFDILKDLMIILTGSEVIKVSGIGLCLIIWCRSHHAAPTLKSLIDALINIGEGPTVNRINGSYYVKKALRNKKMIKLKWTALSISGPQGTGKSCFLRLLHNKTLSTPETNIKISPDTEAILETSSLMAAKEATSDPWEIIDTKILKRMLIREVTQDHVSESTVRPPLQAYINTDATISRTGTLQILDSQVRQLLEERVAELLQQLPTKNVTVRRLSVTPNKLVECLERLNALRNKSDDMLQLSGKMMIYHDIKASLSKLITLEKNVHLLGYLLPSSPPVSPRRPPIIKEESAELTDDEIFQDTPPPIPPRPLSSRLVTSSAPATCANFLPRPVSFDSVTSSLPAMTPPELPPRMTSSVSTDTVSTLPSSFIHMKRPPFDTMRDLADVLDDLSSLPRSLSQTHFVHIITTRGNPMFRDLLPALFRYNTANVVTHPLNEELDTFTENELNHEKILESSIHSLSLRQPPPFKGTMSPQRPNFVVLGTYYDMLNFMKDPEEIKEYVAVRNHEIKSKLTNFSEFILRYGSSLVFPINTTALDEPHTHQVIEAIRRKISKCYFEMEIPLVWFLLQLVLIRQKRLKTFIEKSELVKIAANFKMTSDDVEQFLLHYHDMCVVFYFPRFLNEIVFLNPQYFLDRLSQLCQLETFNRRQLINITENSIQFADYLLQLCKSLYLITPTGSNEYFFPSVLQRASNLILETFDENRDLDPLVVKWPTGPVPQGLFPALVVSLIHDHEFQLMPVQEAESRYRNVVRLSESGEDVTLIDYFYWIEIHFDDPLRCHEIKSKIYASIKNVVSVFKYDSSLSSPKEHFLCIKEHGENSKEHVLKRHLCTINDSKEMVTCSIEGTSCLINFTKQLPWIRVSRSQKNKYIEDVDTVLTILKEGSFRFRKWVKLGLSLGLQRSELNSIKYDSTSKCLEECLTVWKNSSRFRQWNELIDALVKIDEKNAADYIRNQL